MLTVLDTHALVWLDQDDVNLGAKARSYADQALQQGHLAVSAITFWEVAMLIAKNRITMTLPVGAWRRELLQKGLVELPVDGEIGIKAAGLDLHGDPADRMIVASCQQKGAMLVTADLPLLEWHGTLERHDART
ncbi:hypothetical protein MCAMS1_01240 [biofilm metagenome]